MTSPLTLALVSCLLLGFRHGFDYDHLAAITDITSVQRGWREGMRLGLLYALGHALTVAALGCAVILLHVRVPAALDRVGERLVGATLIALAVYVLVSAVRARRDGVDGGAHGHAHVSRSRIALLVSAGEQGWWQVARRFGSTRPRPEPFRFRYENSSVFFVGIVHGLGAETPSQLMLFLLAANLGGTGKGLIGLGCFLLGLLMMNTLMTASASGLFASGGRRPRLEWLLSSLTVVYSFVIGTVFLFGWSDRLPALAR